MLDNVYFMHKCFYVKQVYTLLSPREYSYVLIVLHLSFAGDMALPYGFIYTWES